MLQFENDSIVICDLDGTRCDIEHRRHFVTKDKKKRNFDAFNELMVDDTVRSEVADMLAGFISMGKTICFLSGRTDNLRDKTIEWLRQNGFPPESYALLLMRATKDSRPDEIIKKEIFDGYFEKEWIHKVIDDRPKVIRMWKEIGLDVIDVGDGHEF